MMSAASARGSGHLAPRWRMRTSICLRMHGGKSFNRFYFCEKTCVLKLSWDVFRLYQRTSSSLNVFLKRCLKVIIQIWLKIILELSQGYRFVLSSHSRTFCMVFLFFFFFNVKKKRKGEPCKKFGPGVWKKNKPYIKNKCLFLISLSLSLSLRVCVCVYEFEISKILDL